jgi:hypothetical protein
LRVLERAKGSSLVLKDAVILKNQAEKPISCFSEDGSMFAYLLDEIIGDNKAQIEQPFKSEYDYQRAHTMKISKSDPYKLKG